MGWLARLFGFSGPNNGRMKLRYFEDVLPVEFGAINTRRKSSKRSPIGPLKPKETKESKEINALKAANAGPNAGQAGSPPPPSPDPAKLFPSTSGLKGAAPSSKGSGPSHVDPEAPEYFKTRPQPVPCDATGLAFSGGGIRSAAVCLGALQALHSKRGIESIDYLSTVSGGGYIGSCLSAATSERGGGAFPFGVDISDSAAVAHLRNFSNYLLPRGRSGVRNYSEAAAVILRGLLANSVIVLATLLLFALLTTIAYPNIAPDKSTLLTGSFLPRLLDALLLRSYYLADLAHLNALTGEFPFRLTLWLLLAIAVVLTGWAVSRSFPQIDDLTDDTDSPLLTGARVLIITTLAVAFLDLQPVAIQLFICAVDYFSKPDRFGLGTLQTLFGALVTFSTAIAALSSSLGGFLKTTQNATKWTTLALRVATKFAIFVAATVLLFALWIVYLYLSASSINAWSLPAALANLQPNNWQIFKTICGVMPSQVVQFYVMAFLGLTVIGLYLQANGYSLHRLYRDRLSKAFLFGAPGPRDTDPPLLDHLKLSDLDKASGPYHILNAAMNVQASVEANRRGRDADFFMFTRHFVGSDLTLYGPTKETHARTLDMETIDPRLDLATAMAISGAAVSANMGGQTVRLLSPTLALLNIRLGYWLRNPRALAKESKFRRNVKEWITNRFFEKFYLLAEMLNQLDEKSSGVYLSDGGHIENLGVYELLKRGCELIIVVDAEADPSMSFGSLLKLERYARIDLGVRIVLPWEAIAQRANAFSKALGTADEKRTEGPHCAVGRVFYKNNAQGIIVYFKSSMTGDEKDYIIDYKKRNPSFPHETTGDQFFSEEQFEVYRALGFHMVDNFFDDKDKFSFLMKGDGKFANREKALAAVKALLPTLS